MEESIRLRWFLLGAVSVVAIACVAGAIVLRSAHGFSALARPTAVEAWLARGARSVGMPVEARNRANPVANTAEALADGRAHWADHCATCHGNDGSGDTEMGRRTYPPAPDMRLPATQRLTDGELFYIIENGVRLTAMPAWGSVASHEEQESWKLVHFIRHLPQLTEEEQKAMEKLNPKSPMELQEEQDDERFLNGGKDDQPNPRRH